MSFHHRFGAVTLLALAACGIPDSTAVADSVEVPGASAEDSLFTPAPPELRGTTVHFLKRRRRPLEPQVNHRLTIAVELPSDLRSRVEGLTLRSPLGAVVLDCAAGRGHWGTDTGLLPQRSCMSPDVTEAATPDGTWRIDIKLTGRAAFGGTFTVTRGWASADVVIDGPANVQFSAPVVTTGPRPALNWRDFRSPQLRAGETREVEVYVTLESPGGLDFNQRFTAGTTSATLTSDLRDGEHRLSVTYREGRAVGPLVLKRDAETLIRFFSKTQPAPEVRVGAFAVTNFLTNELVFIDATGRIVKDHVGVDGDGPHAIAFGDGAFVVTNSKDNTLSVFDAHGRLVRSRIGAGRLPESVSFGAGAFVVTNGSGGDLTFVNANGDALRPNLRLGGASIVSMFGRSLFAVADFAGSRVDLIDAGGNVAVGAIPVGSGPRGVAFGNGVFVVTGSGTNDVTVLDETGRVFSTVPVGRSPRGVAFGDGVFVTANADSNTVTLLGEGGRVVPDVPVGRTPKGVAFGEGVFAITNFDGDSVTLLDKTGRVIATVPVGSPGLVAQPMGITFAEITLP